MSFYELIKQTEITIDDDKIHCDFGTLEYSIDEYGATVHSINVNLKRCGVGTKLVETFENLSEKFGFTSIDVPASPTKEAILFWKSLGYKPASSDDKYWVNKIIRSRKDGYWDTLQGVVVMEKNLSKSKKGS